MSVRGSTPNQMLAEALDVPIEDLCFDALHKPIVFTDYSVDMNRFTTTTQTTTTTNTTSTTNTTTVTYTPNWNCVLQESHHGPQGSNCSGTLHHGQICAPECH